MDCVKGIDLSTRGLGETFLDYIKDSTGWKDDLIRAIHQDKSIAGGAPQSYESYMSQRQERLQGGILNSLRYPEMTDRHDRIAEAHEKMFRWMFLESNASQLPWTNLTQWLESDSTLY